jgi:uncharacterized protein YwqG
MKKYKKYLMSTTLVLTLNAFAAGNALLSESPTQSFKKSAVIEFHKTEPITERITKFGGQPVWLTKATWPISKKTGKPMQFIGQIKIDKAQLPEGVEKMAYIFMTDVKDEFVDGTYLAEGGENAVIVQPGTIPSFVKIINSETGPSLEQEFTVNLIPLIEPFKTYSEFELLINALPEEIQEQFRYPYAKTKIGGTPIYIQGEETPPGEGWEFLLQINSRDVPFHIDLGDVGKAYIYLNNALNEGRMLWQCS